MRKKIEKKQIKLNKLKKEAEQLEAIINDLKTISRQQCPVNRVCRCSADSNWDGVCMMSH